MNSSQIIFKYPWFCDFQSICSTFDFHIKIFPHFCFTAQTFSHIHILFRQFRFIYFKAVAYFATFRLDTTKSSGMPILSAVSSGDSPCATKRAMTASSFSAASMICPSFFPDSKAVIDMLKSFHICPGLVDDVPLNIIRCQQLIDQKTVLLQQRFKLRIGKS